MTIKNEKIIIDKFHKSRINDINMAQLAKRNIIFNDDSDKINTFMRGLLLSGQTFIHCFRDVMLNNKCYLIIDDIKYSIQLTNFLEIESNFYSLSIHRQQKLKLMLDSGNVKAHIFAFAMFLYFCIVNDEKVVVEKINNDLIINNKKVILNLNALKFD